MAYHLSHVHQLRPNSGNVSAIGTGILIVSRNRHKAAELDGFIPYGGPSNAKSAPIADDEEDWLRQLASTDETEQQEARQALTESYEMTDSFTVRMPEDETSM
ncbi:hypothetical protein B0H14DRAFT_2643270 [Mycena olivaceomarginata]|nr:hypothetical protein B0H14DRAFT_2643270 [Mycena olivaceomarginata]